MAKRLAQHKIDAKNNGWPWPITHPNDERALLENCYPDFQAAERVRRFYAQLLRVPQEGGGTQPFHLLDWWYRDVLAQLFGWKRADKRRRFDKGFITTAKKSGKSTVLAGLPLYMITADGEEEAEAYAAATTRDQATILFRKTLRSVRLSPHLSSVIRDVESKKQLFHDASGSTYEAISSDADAAEGKNPHLLVVDELHVWKSRQYFNALMYGDIIRTQPLFLMITTAGENADCIGYEEYEFAKDLLDPNNEFYSQSHFAFISEAENVDAWDDPDSWTQAQPSIRGEVDVLRPRDDDNPAEPRTIGSLEKLATKCEEAKQSPRKRREFIRYICNRWVTASENIWLDPDAWRACGGDIPSHVGERCWGALDLASHADLTALCLAFWREQTLDLIWQFWTPSNRVKQHEHDWRVPLSDWIDRGYVTAVPGDTIEHAAIRRHISGVTLDEHGKPSKYRWDECVAKQYKIATLAYDPWNAVDLVEVNLFAYDGIDVTKIRQGFASMTSPTKEFERRVLSGTLCHGNNPVVDWMARHCVVDQDAAGNLKPNKEKSRLKIDGIVAGIMAVGVAVGETKTRLPYHDRGFLTT